MCLHAHSKHAKKLRIIGAWRSLAARLLWEQEVGGSNPLAPTNLIYNIHISGQVFMQNTAKYAGILTDPNF